MVRRFGIGLFLSAIVIYLSLGAMFFWLRRQDERRPSLNTEAPLLSLRGQPPEPRLQSNPPADLQSYLNRENRLLSSYAWLHRERGITRIPIERAMALLASPSPKPFRKRSPDAQAAPVAPSLGDVRFEQRLGSVLPFNASFTDEHGHQRALGTYFGERPVVLVFTYLRCPNLCTLVLNGLVQALREVPDHLGKDYQVLAISIDPSERPPLALAKKRSCLARLGEAGDNGDSAPWHFLMGEEAQIQRLASSAGFRYRRDPESGEYSHPSGILIITPKGAISQYFFGIQFEPKALHQALLAARSHQKGSWAQEILLYCFHYDPRLSRNGAIILKVIRLAGGFGALGLFTWLACLFRAQKESAA